MAPPRNPPQVFEGRKDARAWLSARLGIEPLSIVWGPLGLGKSALALRAMADAKASRVIHRSALETPDAQSFLIGLARDLSALTLEQISKGQRSIEDLLSLVFELAGRTRAVIVLDDLHALEEPASEALLLGASRYVQGSSVVALTRTRPRHDELADATLRLEPLTDEEIARLLARCAPTRKPTDLASFVASAHGSPYRARRLLLSDGGDPGGFLLTDASPHAKRIARAMRLLRAPIQPSPEIARELDDRGLVRHVALGLVLDDRLRKLIDAEPFDEAEARADAQKLLESTKGAWATFDATRLAIEGGDFARAASILDARGFEELFDEGYAASLFELLSGAPGFSSQKFACADWMLGGPSLAWALQEPEPGDPSTRLAWCRLLVHGGAVARAKSATAALAKDGPPEVRARAQWLYADVLRHAGEIDAAIAHLETLDAKTPQERMHRDVRLATALAVRGDLARAGAVIGDLRDLLASPTFIEKLEHVDRLELRRYRARLGSAFLSASRFRDLERLIGADGPPADCRADELFHHLALASERGRFALVRKLAERVRPLVDASVNMRFVHGYSLIRARLTEGALDGLVELANKLAFDVQSFGQPELAHWGWSASAAVSVVVDPGARIAELPSEVSIGEGTTRTLIDAWRAILRARAGDKQSFVATGNLPPATGNLPPDVGLATENPPAATENLPPDVGLATENLPPNERATDNLPPDVERATENLPPDVGLVAKRAEAECALAANDVERAGTILDHAVASARTEGLAIEEIHLLALLLDARLLGSARGSVEAAANDLERAANEIGSPRFIAEARLARWLVSDPQDPVDLLAFADEGASPISQRRARALLGRETKLDALDRRVVARFQPTTEMRAGVLVLDLSARTLRLPNGRKVDLPTAELPMRILETLVRGGGRASKEELARRAWGLNTYHPQRDDKRLQVAVYRLRKVIEETPSAPTLLVLEGDGYRITVPVELGRL